MKRLTKKERELLRDSKLLIISNFFTDYENANIDVIPDAAEWEDDKCTTNKFTNEQINIIHERLMNDMKGIYNSMIRMHEKLIN